MTSTSGFLTRSARTNNLELAVPIPSGFFKHGYRTSADPDAPWAWSTSVGSDDANIGYAQVLGEMSILDSVGTGDLEVFARTVEAFKPSGKLIGVPLEYLAEFSRDASGHWSERHITDEGAEGQVHWLFAGAPAVVQSELGTRGNYELVIPLASGGLRHYYRDNDAPDFPWPGHDDFGKSLGVVDAVAMIAGNFNKNLEVIARAGRRLFHLYRDSNTFRWHGPDATLDADADGTPGFVQSKFGNRGNFELVTPRADRGLQHWWRDNDQPGFPWYSGAILGREFGRFTSASLIFTVDASHPDGGYLEGMARSGDALYHFVRDAATGWQVRPHTPVLTC